MLDFDLPFLSGANSIKVALAETIEANKSGLLYETDSGELRVVSYDEIVQALQSDVQLLEALESASFEPVVRIETVPRYECYDAISTMNLKFGFRGFDPGGVALLLSVSESFANAYNSPSTGVRCQRPNKPSNIRPRDWYHYYPPNALPLLTPHTCNVCGATV